MKHLKTYENINNDIKLGDYVLLQYDNNSTDYDEFLSNNIGIIVNISDSKEYFYVGYSSIPYNLKSGFSFEFDNSHYTYNIPFSIDDIKYYASTKDKLETMMQADKYNL